MRIWLIISTYLFFETDTILALPPKDVVVNVITRKWTHLLNEKFLSFTLQPHIALEFQDYKLDSHHATLNMFKALSPGMLRLGGPETNYLTFLTPGYNSEYTILEEQWKKINKFCQKTKLDLIVCVNPMERVHEVWQSRGVLEFIDASDKLGYDLQWQLGYEMQKLTNNSESLSGIELGRDVVRMRKILDAFPRYSKSAIIGPDVIASTSPEEIKFIKEYVNESGEALNALTWHPNFSSEEREMEDVSRTLSQIQHQLENVIWARDLTKPPFTKQITKKEVWLSESNPEEYTGKFSDALTWARRLGTAAVLGFPVLMKQITTTSISQPTPDFWVSVLYKSLVGRAVLETKLVTGDKNTLHTYAHCTEMSQNNIIDGDFEYERGAVTVYGLNLANESLKLNLKASLKDESIHIYILTAENKDSEETYLNGQLLSLSPAGELPLLSPKVKNATRNIVVDIPPNSVYFLVLPDTKVRPCTLYPTSQISDSKSNAIPLGSTSVSNAESLNKNGDDDKEIYVRFGPKKKNKNSIQEDFVKNESPTEKFFRVNFLTPEFENGDEKDLDRPVKSIKEASTESLGKNRHLKTLEKDNSFKLGNRLRSLRKDRLNINKINDNNDEENNNNNKDNINSNKNNNNNNNNNDDEKNKELSEAMLNTKFILFSDDDWMSDFSHAKKAVEAAKKIIEAFDEAEMMKKKESQQKSVLQVENDKYHIQYGKEALRTKKFAVLSASTLEKQNSTTDNNTNTNNSNENKNNTKEIILNQDKLPTAPIAQIPETEAINKSLPNDFKNEHDRHRRFTDNKITKIPISGNDINPDLLLSDDTMPHVVIKRKQGNPYSEQQSYKNVNNLTQDKATKEIIPSPLFYVKKSENLDPSYSMNEQLNEKSFPTSDVILKKLGNSAESKNKYETEINEKHKCSENVFENKEIDSDEFNSKEINIAETYYPGEYYEHKALKKVKSGDNICGYDDLSEAEVPIVVESDNVDLNHSKEGSNLVIVKEPCKDAQYDKIMKENAERQLNNYYENAKNTFNFYEEMDGNYSDGNWNEKIDDHETNHNDAKLKKNKKETTIKFSKQNDIRIKRAVDTKPKIKISESNEKTANFRGHKFNPEKGNERHNTEIKRNKPVKNRFPRDGKINIQKIRTPRNKHLRKREITAGINEHGSVSENLGMPLSKIEPNFSIMNQDTEGKNMTEKKQSKRENESKLLLNEHLKEDDIKTFEKNLNGSNLDFSLKNNGFFNKSDNISVELSDQISKINEKGSSGLLEMNKNVMNEKDKVTSKAEATNFKTPKLSEKNLQMFHEDNNNLKTSNGSMGVITNSSTEPQNYQQSLESKLNFSSDKLESKEALWNNKDTSISVSVTDGDKIASNLNSDQPKSEISYNSTDEQNGKHDIDIVCGRTKNFGTFCIGSERQTDSTDENSQNSKDIIKSEEVLSNYNNNFNWMEMLTDNKKYDTRYNESNSIKKINILPSIDLNKPSEDRFTFLQRREINENAGMPKIDNLEKEVGQDYVEEGSPMCKASRAAPYVEDFEELLSQMQGSERNSDKMRQRRLIQFTVPAMNLKKVNDEGQVLLNSEEIISQDNVSGNKSESDYVSLVNNSHLNEQSEEIQSSDDLVKHGDDKGNRRNLAKVTQNDKLTATDIKIGKNPKRTVMLSRKENNQDYYGLKDEGMEYNEEEDEEEIFSPKKIIMVPVRNFRNKGNFMMGNYYYDDEFSPKKQKVQRIRDDYGRESYESNKFDHNRNLQETKGLYQVPHGGLHKNRFSNIEQDPQWNRKNKKEHDDVSGDDSGQIEEEESQNPSRKPHLVKSTPVQIMPFMVMSPDMYKPKYSSRSSSQRLRRSFVPSFHNFRDDTANLKIDNNQSQKSHHVNKYRIHPRSPNIKRQYPLNSNTNSLMTKTKHSSGHFSGVVKEAQYKKRSARDLSNSFIEKEKLMKELNNKENAMNEIIRDLNNKEEGVGWKAEDAYDTALIRDKNKLISTLTNKLANLTKLYVKESVANDKVISSGDDVKEEARQKSITLTNSKDLKNSAEEEENKASEVMDNINKTATKTTVILTGIPKIIQEAHPTPKNAEGSQHTYNFIVNQIKNLINYIGLNLRQLNYN